MGHVDELIARLRELEATGEVAVYPEDLLEQLLQPGVRERIEEIERRVHHPSTPEEARNPPELPPGLINFPVEGLSRIFFYVPEQVIAASEVTDSVIGVINEVRQQARSEKYGSSKATDQAPQLTDQPPLPAIERRGKPVFGFDRLHIGTDAADEETTVPALLAEVHKRLAVDNGPDHNLVAPNHILMGGPLHCGGPGNNPDNKKPALHPIADAEHPEHEHGSVTLQDLRLDEPKGNAGRGITIAVLDTGILPACELPAWMRGNIVYDSDADVENDYFDVEDGQQFIRYPRVHGTFVAGIILQVAPAATLLMKRLLDKEGKADDYQFGQALQDVLDSPHGPPQIINLSLGCPSWQHDPPPILGEAYKRVITHDPPIVMVASAGNAGNADPYWPASAPEPEVIGVGAVDRLRNRAEFSNFGPPVKVWAVGLDVTSVYAHGVFARPDMGIHHRPFQGIASWGGTSFAAPLVTGLIAKAMTEEGHATSEAAARAVLNPPHAESTAGSSLPNGHGDRPAPMILRGLARHT